MYSTKETKPTHQRNVTPNFLRFKRKSASKNPKEEEVGGQQKTAERGESKASRTSLEVHQKRVLHLSKLKNAIGIRESSLEAAVKRKEGTVVTTRKSTPPKKVQDERDNRSRKTSISGSTKNIRQKDPTSREKSQRTSITKRSQESLQKQEQRAKLQNKEFNNFIQQHYAPNFLQKHKYKKIEQKEKTKASSKKKFMNVDFEMKGEQELKNYQIYEQLGKGAYGIVKMGISKRTNQKVAIKIYEKKRLDEPNKLKNLEREINILSKLNHPVIAKLIDVIEGSTEIYLIQEYGGANSLYNYLLSKKEHRLEQQEAKRFFKIIAETLKYLHQRNIVHRDIKAENILLNRNKELKLIDFGFSLESHPPNIIDTFCGTPTYMAPEIVSKKDHIPYYTDLWSLGIFFYVMLQGNYPFRAKNEADLFQKIRKGNFVYIYDDISNKSKQVIERLIRVSPTDRLKTIEMDEAFWEWLVGDCKPMAYEPTAVTNITTNAN